MIEGFKQTDKRLLPEIRKWGCVFLTLAECSPLCFIGAKGIEELNLRWKTLVKQGFITGDLNEDGDADDDGESEIQSWQGVIDSFLIKAKYDGKHHNAEEKIPFEVKFVLGFYKWKGGHFVELNKNKEVIYDSMGQSNTVKNGKLYTMRWLYAI